MNKSFYSFLLFAFLSSLSTASNAGLYYWSSTHAPTVPFEDPTRHCAMLAQTLSNTPYYRLRDDAAIPDRRKFCDSRGSQNQTYSTWTFTRSTCPTGTEFDSATSSCKPPEDKCAASAGQEVMHEHKVGTVTGQSGDNLPIAICDNSCQATYVDNQNRGCRREEGGTDYALCKFAYKKNGVSCTSSTDPQTGTSVFDQPPTKAPSDIKPEYSKEDSCEKWVTGSDGTASRKCTSKEVYDNPGKLDCTTSAASISCTPSKPPPAYNEKDVKQDEVKTTNPDGSTKTETTKDTTTKNCHGTKPCKTDTNTTKETSNTNPDGSKGDSALECTGGNCTLDPDKESDPSADPDKEQEEQEESESSVAGESCSSQLACDGDPVQCAILRKNKEQLCAWDYEQSKAGIESAVSGDSYQLGTDSLSLGDSFSEGSNGPRWLSSSCPSPRSLSVLGHSYTLSWQPLCNFATSLSFLFVAMSGIFFAVYVGRGLGGQ